MCGLAGFFNPQEQPREVDTHTCKKMLSAMHYRGPDEEGCVGGVNFVLGHKRLAIIDISSGQQPMVSPCNQYILVFNGEIYNHPSLRQELIESGCTFRTRSDTEVLLWGYQVWGKEVLNKIKGMFAFVILDKQKNILFGARDHLGKKPLYYFLTPDKTLVFASDLKALAASEILPGHISPEAMQFYLTLGFIPAPWTIYHQVYKLEAAQSLEYSILGLKKEIYWDPINTSQNLTSGESLESLFQTAVRTRLETEVPLGAFLSGGIDSNLVVSEIAKCSSSPLETYTMGFKATPVLVGVRDEREVAKSAANYYGCINHSIELSEVSESTLAEIIPYLGEPLGDPSILPTWLVCKEAKKHATVILTGDGGDEPFGGYTFRYLPHLKENKIKNHPLIPLLKPLINILSKVWPDSSKLAKPLRIFTLLRNLSVSDAQAFFLDLSIVRGKKQVFSSQLSKLSNLPMQMVVNFYQKHKNLDSLNKAMYADVKMYMCEDVLVKADRISMAHSLELRSPLLDKSIIEKAFTLPSTSKINLESGKLPLRELALNRVAPGILNFPKTGFSFPAQDFLRSKWSIQLSQMLKEYREVMSEWLEMKEVEKKVDLFLKGENIHFSFVWALFVLCLWIKHFHRKQIFLAKKI